MTIPIPLTRLHDWSQVRLKRLQRPGNSQADGPGLARHSATFHGAHHVESSRTVGELQSLHGMFSHVKLEIVSDTSTIDGHLSSALLKPYASNTGLPSPSAVRATKFIHFAITDLRFQTLKYLDGFEIRNLLQYIPVQFTHFHTINSNRRQTDNKLEYCTVPQWHHQWEGQKKKELFSYMFHSKVDDGAGNMKQQY